MQNGVVEPMEYDMEMFIETCSYCVYPGSYGTHRKMPDMINIIIRAMGQGLGLTSNFVGGEKCNDGGPEIEFKFEEEYRSAFIKPNLFDSHLYTENVNLHKVFQSLNSKHKYGVKIDLESLCNSTRIQKLNGLLDKPDSIYFKTSKGNQVYIETGTSEDGKVNYLSKRYNMSKDSLMTPTIWNHGDILDIFDSSESWSTSPLGSYTLEVLETLGYKVNRYPDPDRSQLALYLQMKKYNGQYKFSH
ncbi:hypothetical protein DSO57_1030560 [Entomophthora muscae]|uniref:Uncharacterized protein n=1 Tax=Entomophthora muscae TaxID=34485 RepID=A0ACC2TC83_9FUNG|nr:hypothetical protein DSO57_1030560 [Entomophthora muscae]